MYFYWTILVNQSKCVFQFHKAYEKSLKHQVNAQQHVLHLQRKRSKSASKKIELDSNIFDSESKRRRSNKNVLS